MNRRDLLKIMAAAPVVSLAGCSPFTNRSMTNSGVAGTSMTAMNLVFEGPFVFLAGSSQVRVLAPIVEGHQYLIDGKPAARAAYTLSGISGAAIPGGTRFDLPQGADAFRLDAEQLHLTLNSVKQPYFSFTIPAPQKMVALAATQVEIIDAFGNQRSALMPTSMAFVYGVTDAQNVALHPATGWSAQSRVVGSHANLVVAAGLPLGAADPSGHHAQTAFAELMSYLPELNMQLLSTGQQMHTGEVEDLPEELRRPMTTARNFSGDAPRARMVTAAMRSSMPRARVLRVSATLDCQTGGVVVTTKP